MIEPGKLESLEEQVRSNLPKVLSLPEFASGKLWLNFDLVGPPENLKRLSVALNKRGWVSVGGWDDGWKGGFLYPGTEVEASFNAIVDTARAMNSLCAQFGAQIEIMDAFDAPGMNRRRCETLYVS